ncbi:hypothetical protein NDU88_006113 [Pleurodeles waltl]|uniref:Uncharacterized protein n=1 Tax=Pleurodeles waltl TaxID=8319 RepID=A0AAV7TZC8_PLEWA|nr:hypothetical protein NDU88_006113 [Pleurodeles waltl]
MGIWRSVRQEERSDEASETTVAGARLQDALFCHVPRGTWLTKVWVRLRGHWGGCGLADCGGEEVVTRSGESTERTRTSSLGNSKKKNNKRRRLKD